MAYKISINTKVSVKPDAAKEATTKVSVTGDTAEEADQICRVLAALRGFGGRQAQGFEIDGPEEPNKALPEGEPESAPLPPIEIIEATEDSLSFKDALASYLAAVTARGLAQSTLRVYGYVLHKFVGTIGPKRCIRTIKEAETSGYIERLRARMKPGSATELGIIIKGFFIWLVERGDIKANPMASIKLRVPAYKLVPPYSNDEIQRLVKAAATPMEQVILTLLLDTGMRASELCNLTWADLDLAQGIIRVHGKGSKIRHVALNHRPKETLAAYEKQGQQYDGRLWPPGFDRQKLARMLRQLAQKAKVADVHPHRFRHTFATQFYRETQDPLALQALLGHNSLTMVRRYIAAAQAEIALATHKEHSPTARL